MGCYILLKLKSIRLLFLHSYYATQLFGSYPFWLWERALIAFFVWAILGIFPSIFFPPMNNKWTRYIGDWCDCRHSDQLAEDDIFRVNPLAFSSDIAYTVHLIPIERIWRTHYYCCWRVSLSRYIDFAVGSNFQLSLWLSGSFFRFFLCLFHLRHARLISRSHICRPQSQSLGTAVYWV
jgi:hypothetical protein